MKKIFIFCPDGTGIKNYLYSDVFKSEEVDLTLFHNFDNDTLAHISAEIKLDNTIQIPNYKESYTEKFLRELIHLCRIKHNAKTQNNPTILKFYKRGHASKKLKIFYGAIDLASKTIKSYNQIIKLEDRYQKALRKNPFYLKICKILEDKKPDVIFCTHQRALKAPTIFAAAQDLNIKSATVIYSWDNIPKARLALKADKYLVWSPFMKNELESFYPEIEPSKIIVTGTPQFEFYKNEKHIIPKPEFYKTYGLDANKKTICFSGDDVKTSPYDPQYLNDVASAIVNENRQHDYQIVFRRCPVDVSGRYDWVIKKFPDLIIEIPPLWNYNNDVWSAVYPTINDVSLLVSLAFYADVVINVGSTMAFDFAMFDKPCVYINYDHVLDPNWSVQTIYNYQHFRSMPSKKAVFWFNNKTEIIQVLDNAIAENTTEINQWFDIVVKDASMASKKILKNIL